MKAYFTGNGSYSTANTFAVDDDATIRWCVSYSGDAHNAEIPLADHGEVSEIDFDPFTPAAIGSGLTLLVWALWSQRRRKDAELASFPGGDGGSLAAQLNFEETGLRAGLFLCGPIDAPDPNPDTSTWD